MPNPSNTSSPMTIVGVMNRPISFFSWSMYFGLATTSRSSNGTFCCAKKLFAAWQSAQVGCVYMTIVYLLALAAGPLMLLPPDSVHMERYAPGIRLQEGRRHSSKLLCFSVAAPSVSRPPLRFTAR